MKSTVPEEPLNPLLKKEEQCCSKFRYKYIGNCCCKWLIPDFSEFSVKFIGGFQYGHDRLWTCNDCEFGFKCKNS